MKNIAILGATGSIGKQALEVVRSNPERFNVQVLTAQNNATLLLEQALEFKPGLVVIGNESLYGQLRADLSGTGIQVLCGEEALSEAAAWPGTDIVLTALVGAAGLKPTIAAIQAGKDIALANKETLVVAGEIVTALASKHGVNILPVDSEHSAIFQCLSGETGNEIEKIILTASGGPFRGRSRDFLATVTRDEALRHPNWVMGAKITIDSASLMNKGLEVIEASWLFGLTAGQIEVIVHPQSIVHSLVQFSDGSIKAQMGLPDMKLPIQYALTYPERIKTDFPRFNFFDYPELSFSKPDMDTFRNLKLAYQALQTGGNKPCVLNAANEVVVAAFLEKRIGFLEMSDVVERCMDDLPFVQQPSLSNYLETDEHTRIFAADLVTKQQKVHLI
ncbi:1-deoxy-D-xylulose-5-phosphate reductoisomerase [Pedobacter sp. SYP-B3415]|uniref:1-deoxy-D-xylulose-5-phosphate reductoisomerase n=1 Tax=Pedobacter sp. SYP-B3415 TaxID=2496641 RepID=UPI00101D4ACE|nr:1-deoxy-D-xylulose-5-phosphate reductoisomerase [Pedobacter sp. SYP-B3415]